MKKKWKIVILLLIAMLMMQTSVVRAEDREWYEFKEETVDISSQLKEILDTQTEITPYTRYIMNATVSIVELSSGKLNVRSEVFCNQEVSKITTVFNVQKKSGNSWNSVGSGTVSQSNSDHMYKSMSASGASSGTYRCIANTTVIGKTGYTETVSVISGSITI